MTCGEQVAWLEAMQSISMAMGGGPLAVLGRCCNRGDWKPEYDGEKLHVSRPHELNAVRSPIRAKFARSIFEMCSQTCTRSDACKSHAYEGWTAAKWASRYSRSYFVIHATDVRV
jgi:hypothetical protein